MSLHKEINFENDVCSHLAVHGWLYAEGDATQYDRPRALYGPDVTADWKRRQLLEHAAGAFGGGAEAAEPVDFEPSRTANNQP